MKLRLKLAGLEKARKPLIGLGAVALAFVALAVVGPSFVNADRFRPDMETKLSQALGLPVVIEKNIELKLLPSPAVTVRGLKIKAAPGAEIPDLVDLRKARLELSFLKLVQGRIAFTAIEMDGLTATLETMADGKPSWQPKSVPAQQSPEKPGNESERKNGQDEAGKPPSPAVEINHLVLSNATLVVRDARSKAESRIEGIGLDAEAGALLGPYKFTGQAKLLGQPLLLSGGLEELRNDRASPLNLEMSLPGPGFKARFAGLLSLLSGGYAGRGKLIVEAPSLDGLARSLGLARGLAADPVRIESTMTASADTFSMDDTRIELAGGTGYGKLRLVVGGETRVEARLDMDRLDLDRLTPKDQPQAASASSANAQSGKVGSGPVPDPVQTAPVGEPAKALTLPTNLSGLVDVKVGTLFWNGQTVEQLRIDAALNGGELTVSQASAQLPGGGEAAFFGFVSNANQGMKFEGVLEAQTLKLRKLLAWLGNDPKSVAANRLQNFRLKASVQGTSQEVRLVNLDAVLDDSRLLGAAILKPGPRPAIGLALDLNRLDLDSYLAPARGERNDGDNPAHLEGLTSAPASQPKQQAPQPSANSAQPFAALSALAGFDANLRLTANNVLWKKTPANRILIDGSLLNGDLILRDAGVGDLAGSSLTARGAIEGVGKGIPSFKKLALEVTSRQPAVLAALTGLSGLDDLGPFAARLLLDGGIDGLDLDGALNAQGAESRFNGRVGNLLAMRPKLEGRAALRHANAAQLLKQGGNWGPLEATALLAADSDRVDLKDMVVKLGRGKIEGAVQAVLSGPRPQIVAKLTGDEIDLDSYLAKKQAAALGGFRHGMAAAPGLGGIEKAAVVINPAAQHWSTSPIDVAWLKAADAKIDLALSALRVSNVRMQKPVLAAELKDGVLSLGKLTANLWGGALDAQARLTGGNGALLEGRVTLSGADLKPTLSDLAGLSQAAGKYDAQARFATQGRSPAELISRLNGDGGFAAKDGMVEGIDLPAVNRQLSNLNNVAGLAGLAASVSAGGKTAFSQMSASFKATNGVVVSNDAKLLADGGAGSGTVKADLPQWLQETKMTFKLSGINNGPSLGMRLVGPLDAPRKFIDIDDLQRWAAEKGLLKGLKGKDLGGLLGGGGTAAPEQQGGEPQPQPPEKMSKKLRGILKGL